MQSQREQWVGNDDIALNETCSLYYNNADEQAFPWEDKDTGSDCLGGDGRPCKNDGDCSSKHCKENVCHARVGLGQACTKHQHCQENMECTPGNRCVPKCDKVWRQKYTNGQPPPCKKGKQTKTLVQVYVSHNKSGSNVWSEDVCAHYYMGSATPEKKEETETTNCKSVDTAECSDDDHCASGYCNKSKCTAKSRIGGECSKDEHCINGKCENKICVPRCVKKVDLQVCRTSNNPLLARCEYGRTRCAEFWLGESSADDAACLEHHYGQDVWQTANATPLSELSYISTDSDITPHKARLDFIATQFQPNMREISTLPCKGKSSGVVWRKLDTEPNGDQLKWGNDDLTTELKVFGKQPSYHVVKDKAQPGKEKARKNGAWFSKFDKFFQTSGDKCSHDDQCASGQCRGSGSNQRCRMRYLKGEKGCRINDHCEFAEKNTTFSWVDMGTIEPKFGRSVPDEASGTHPGDYYYDSNKGTYFQTSRLRCTGGGGGNGECVDKILNWDSDSDDENKQVKCQGHWQCESDFCKDKGGIKKCINKLAVGEDCMDHPDKCQSGRCVNDKCAVNCAVSPEHEDCSALGKTCTGSTCDRLGCAR